MEQRTESFAYQAAWSNLENYLQEARSLPVAKNKLGNLTDHPSLLVRYYLAKNPTTPEKTLLVLAQDYQVLVKERAQKSLTLRRFKK